MYDKTYVRFVYPHAKSNGSNDDLHIVLYEYVLVPAPCSIGKTRMIWQGIESAFTQFSGQFIYGLATLAIYYPAFVFSVPQEFYDLFIGIFLWPDLIKQVLTVETGYVCIAAFNV